MGYLYELHCHTEDGSACGRLPVKELVQYYHDLGYAGLCITDHFTGNSALPEDTSWEDRVNHCFAVYEQGRAEGERLGISVFPGMEYSLLRNPTNFKQGTGNDFVILGLTKEWMLAHSDMFAHRPAKNFAEIRAAGGFVIQAHPFSEAEWIEYIRLMPRSIDAVEIYNAHIADEFNQRAKQYAESYGLLETCGSDTHAKGHEVCAMETETPCQTVHDLIAAIREKRTKIRYPE